MKINVGQAEVLVEESDRDLVVDLLATPDQVSSTKLLPFLFYLLRPRPHQIPKLAA